MLKDVSNNKTRKLKISIYKNNNHENFKQQSFNGKIKYFKSLFMEFKKTIQKIRYLPSSIKT
jgi:hypothetical protein